MKNDYIKTVKRPTIIISHIDHFFMLGYISINPETPVNTTNIDKSMKTAINTIFAFLFLSRRLRNEIATSFPEFDSMNMIPPVSIMK